MKQCAPLIELSPLVRSARTARAQEKAQKAATSWNPSSPINKQKYNRTSVNITPSFRSHTGRHECWKSTSEIFTYKYAITVTNMNTIQYHFRGRRRRLGFLDSCEWMRGGFLEALLPHIRHEMIYVWVGYRSRIGPDEMFGYDCMDWKITRNGMKMWRRWIWGMIDIRARERAGKDFLFLCLPWIEVGE